MFDLRIHPWTRSSSHNGGRSSSSSSSNNSNSNSIGVTVLEQYWDRTEIVLEQYWCSTGTVLEHTDTVLEQYSTVQE